MTEKPLEQLGLGDLRGIMRQKAPAEAWHHFNGAAETKATVRCIPFDQPGGKGKCIYSGQETDVEVIFAQAY